MSISAVNGGVRAQALNTLQHIKNFNVEPELLSPWDPLEDLNLDIVHIFGASYENVGVLKAVKDKNIPIVLSPVFYSNRKASVIKKAIQLEKSLKFLGSGIQSEFGVKAEICHLSDILLPNTHEEANLIMKGFSIDHSKISVIPNGVEKRFAQSKADLFYNKYGIKDFILFVGQAGAPRKNAISLLKIAPYLKVPIVVIGSLSNDSYGIKCRELASKYPHVHLLETLPHQSDLLASAYAACKVFVLPSYYETPGIAALEAALSGANIAITEKGGTKEYFLDHASYLDPENDNSVLKAINNALQKDKDGQLKQHILDHYTWENIAEMTTNIYSSLTV